MSLRAQEWYRDLTGLGGSGIWDCGWVEEPEWSRAEQPLTVLTHPSRTRNTNATPVLAPQAEPLNGGDFLIQLSTKFVLYTRNLVCLLPPALCLVISPRLLYLCTWGSSPGYDLWTRIWEVASFLP